MSDDVYPDTSPDRADRADRADRREPREPRDVREPRASSERRPTGEHRALSQYDVPQVERLVNHAIDLIENARTMPMSSSIRLDREEMLGLLNEIAERLPDELRAARWLLKERDEFLARVRREGDELLDMARARAERMVQRTEVAKAAELRARHVLDEADQDARRMRLEAEDYCDQRLASFEAVLDRISRTVAEGRARLQGTPLDDLPRSLEPPPPPPPPSLVPEPGQEFFDQDD